MQAEGSYAAQTKRRGYLAVKRIFDVILSLFALIILSPVLLLISLLVKLSSKGPVFFCHRRVGLDGKEFLMYKFRTMVRNAEDRKNRFTKEQLQEFQTNYKLKADPRITPFGNILRKTSMDELPQLVNVLKGEMSLIGPRPIVRDEIPKYGQYAEILLTVLPGVSGLWQVNGRNNTTYEERVQLDVEYIRHRCLRMDLKIFFMTFREVLSRLGAY